MENTNIIQKGTAHAIRILVAEELGLSPEYAVFAKLYLENLLHPMQYGRLEAGGIDAVKKIKSAGLVSEATKLAGKHLKIYAKLY